MSSAWTTAEAVARDHRARLVAILARRTRNIAAAEDSLSDAFAAALETWPEKGVPDNPEAWLLSAALRRYLDGWRRTARHAELKQELQLLDEELSEREEGLTDRRLELMFVCAHPAIDASVHAPLMLQTILGLTAEQIAPLWLLSPAAMGQRLVRAKSKLSVAQASFDMPLAEEKPQRIEAVLSAIYAALTLEGEGGSLAREAEYLAALVVHGSPEHPEALGLLALCLYRTGWQGVEDQASWDEERLDRAEAMLKRSAHFRQPGRYQLEAAIQSAHVHSLRTGKDVTDVVLQLYERLIALAPSLGARCGHAAALVEGGRVDEAKRALDALAEQADGYLPYWLVKARLATQDHDVDGARTAYDRAIALATDEKTRERIQVKCSA
ncbi:MAG: RNA polymerase subunit sigma-70 [Parvularculaceae bacterium]|nr:RNA polymerase subunit sigma-70 [Parvularculaceae bacterium]